MKGSKYEGQFRYEQNYFWDNIKLLLMFFSCVFAMIAQFYPIPFPASRPLLGVCCVGYFVLSSVLQYIISYVDKDTIMITNPSKCPEDEMRIRTSFPRFQEIFTLTIQPLDPKSSNQTIGEMYVGKYFTEKGEFDEEGYANDLIKHIQRYQEKKYQTFKYNHGKKND